MIIGCMFVSLNVIRLIILQIIMLKSARSCKHGRIIMTTTNSHSLTYQVQDPSTRPCDFANHLFKVYRAVRLNNRSLAFIESNKLNSEFK